jgi:NTE family protein
MSHAAQRTAFVFAGGGSLGAVQVGMLHELMHAGVSADLVLGSSVGGGANRIIVLPTGFACALHEPPKGAIARALHAITLLIAHQMVRDLRELGGKVDESLPA